MRAEIVRDIKGYFGFDADATRIIPLEGGFTNAEKFSMQDSTREADEDIFIKYANLESHPEEAIILDNEAFMYGVISKIDDIRQYFPKFIGYMRNNQTAALGIEYLPHLTWGGPWTRKNIDLLSSALDTVHTAAIEPLMAQSIEEKAGALQAKRHEQDPYALSVQRRKALFERAANFSTGELTNSRGQTYYQLVPDLLQCVRQIVLTSEPNTEKKFLIGDLNFGNIGFSDSQAYFVDPVYGKLGNPHIDRVVVGTNILRTTPRTEDNKQLIDTVTTKFFVDKVAFAGLITYWIACTSLDYRGTEDAWMDFQQSCATTALETWSRLHDRR